MEKLNDLFKSRCVVSFTNFDDEPTVQLTERVFEGCECLLPIAMEVYEGCLERQPTLPVIPDLPPCLIQLFALLRHCAATKHPLFSNGAGKAFVSQLLSLSSITGEQWVVRSSTTSNPLTDWCRVVPGLREPAITGVVDILLQTMAGEPLLVGEVKSRVVPRNSANLQLVAELRMLQRRTPKRGIVGLLVDPS